MSNRGHRAWIWYLVMVWERFGAGGKQHNRSGAVLASTGGTGRGRLPVPSPASTSTNYTNSTARAPAAEAKGPGGRGACREPRGAWRRRQERQGKIAKRGHQQVHSTKDLALTQIDYRLLFRTDTGPSGPKGARRSSSARIFFAHAPTQLLWDRGEVCSGGQAAQSQRGSAGFHRRHGARASARPLPRFHFY